MPIFGVIWVWFAHGPVIIAQGSHVDIVMSMICTRTCHHHVHIVKTKTNLIVSIVCIWKQAWFAYGPVIIVQGFHVHRKYFRRHSSAFLSSLSGCNYFITDLFKLSPITNQTNSLFAVCVKNVQQIVNFNPQPSRTDSFAVTNRKAYGLGGGV